VYITKINMDKRHRMVEQEQPRSHELTT